MKKSENIKQDLTLFRELITCAHNLYFWTFDSNLDNIYNNCPNETLLEYMSSSEVTTRFTNNPDLAGPIVLTNEFDFLWIADFERNIEGKLLHIHVLGPVFIEDIPLKKLEKHPSLSHYNYSQRMEFINSLKELPVLSITRFYEYGLMLHYCITGDKITVSDLLYSKTENANSKDHETERIDSHGTWTMEQTILKMVEDGNLNFRQEASRQGTGANVGSLGNGDPVRQIKNMTIIFTALCTRAAIKGGLPIEVAYTMSDYYIQSIEACSDFHDIVEINAMMQDDFVNRVHQIKLNEGLSLQIKQCCSFIDLHVKDHLSLADIAKEVGYSETYLSKKFKQEMGQTISDYILDNKIEYAKNLLKTSTYTIHQIAEELNFHSHSYFCEQFKKKTGVSPSEYRNGT